jgi:hypothetical protein
VKVEKHTANAEVVRQAFVELGEFREWFRQNGVSQQAELRLGESLRDLAHACPVDEIEGSA